METLNAEQIKFGLKECAKCEYNLRCQECIYNKTDISKLIADTKADTVRKMQERLMAEERIFEAYGTRWKVIYSSAIDQIAKEMLESEDAE